MKGKKKEENVDLTNLPKINVFKTSLIFKSENPEKRMKLLETIFKGNHKFLRLITRENLIEFAKEKGIFVEPVENKKDPNLVEKRDINPEELAKAANAIILDRSIPSMKEKKALIDKIEELKKQKEEAVFLRDNPQPVDSKKPTKPADKNKQAPVNPDDIIIPVIDDYQVDLGVVFYNYPLDIKEVIHLEKENVSLNHVLLLRDLDEYIPMPEEPKEEIPDPKKKGPPPKDNKNVNNELVMFQKYFAAPPRASDEIFYDLKLAKYNSEKNSILRLIYFDNWDFTTKEVVSNNTININGNNNNDDANKKDPFLSFVNHYADIISSLNKFLLHFLKWSNEIPTVKLNEFLNDPAMLRNIHEHVIEKLLQDVNMKKKDLEHFSIGAVLISFYIDLVKHMREINHIGEHNMIIYEKNDVNNIFEKLENEIFYEYSADAKASVNENINNEYNTNSHVLSEQQKELEKHEQDINKIDELSSYFKLIIDEKDFILKSSMDNEIENFSLGEREKTFNLFRKFPGIARYLMCEVPPKEENYRKAKKCEVYPFLDPTIGIPLYEKYDIIKKFENIFKEKISEYDFDFGDRIYQEIMNRDLLSQTINQAMIFDTETLFHYNERDDNLLFSAYYRCPKGRIYRKTNKYRYLSKPNFDNWINYFKPVFHEKKDIELNLTTAKSKPTTPFGNNSNINPINANLGGNIINDNNFNNDPNITNINNNENLNQSPKREKKPDITFGNNFDHESHLLYDVDDLYLGEVTEKIKYMFPSDNGVFIKKVLYNGIFKTYNSYVIKDNLIFGIKKNKDNITEFWLRFDNEVLMTVNNIGNYDSLKENNDSKNGAYTNFTFKNGLNVQILPNGEICQKIENLKDGNNLSDIETHRIITSKASIISHYKLNKINILYANGNVCTIHGGVSINTNNKGYRVAKRLQDNFEYEMDPCAITIQSDPETNSNYYIYFLKFNKSINFSAKTLIRDDNVMTIKYPDNSMLTIHEDNTKVFTFPDHLKYLVEHESI